MTNLLTKTYTEKEISDLCSTFNDPNKVHNSKKMRAKGVSDPVVPMMSMIATAFNIVKNQYNTLNIRRIKKPVFKGQEVEFDLNNLDKGILKLIHPVYKKIPMKMTFGNSDKPDLTVEDRISIHSDSITLPIFLPERLKHMNRTSQAIASISQFMWDASKQSLHDAAKKFHELDEFGFSPFYNSFNFQADPNIETMLMDDPTMKLELYMNDFNFSLVYYLTDVTITAKNDAGNLFKIDLSLAFALSEAFYHTLISDLSVNEETQLIKGEEKDKTMVIVGGSGALGYELLTKFYENYNIILVDQVKPYLPEGFHGAFVKQDITADDATENIREIAKQIGDGSIDTLCYAFAFGDVGFPSYEATDAQIAKANSFSVDPIFRLTEGLDIKDVVAYSAFTYMFTGIFDCYGAMEASKAELERRFKDYSGDAKMYVVKAGHFSSRSALGILIPALNRLNEEREKARKADNGGEEKDNGPIYIMDGMNRLLDKEKKTFGSTIRTAPSDLSEATETLLSSNYPSGTIYEVMGDKRGDPKLKIKNLLKIQSFV